MCHGAGEAKFCQFAGFVAMKNVRNNRVARSLLVGTMIPLTSVMFSPRSSPCVLGSSTITAPSMYGWILQTNT